MARNAPRPQPVERRPEVTARVQAIVVLLASGALFLTTAVMLSMIAAGKENTLCFVPLTVSLLPQAVVTARSLPGRRRRLL